MQGRPRPPPPQLIIAVAQIHHVPSVRTINHKHGSGEVMVGLQGSGSSV